MDVAEIAGQSVNPQDQLLFLLGGMDAKIDGVVREQAAARTDAAEFRAEVKTDVASLRADVGVVVGRVDILESKQRPRTPWYFVVGSIVGLSTLAITMGITFTQIVQAVQH